MLAAAACLLLVALGVAPGVLAADALVPDAPALERRALGLISGLALSMIASYLTAMVGALLLAPLLLALAGGLFFWLRRRRPAPRAPAEFGLGGLLGGALAIVAALAVFAVPMLMRPMPQGWDPAFHTSIVESIRNLGSLPSTWGPYEPGEKFNYPAALHAWLALASRMGGLSPDFAFTLGFCAIGAVMLVAAWALGVRFGKSALAGALAALLYGLTDGWGTLASHANWGGLPNLAGLALMSGFVLAVSRPSRGATVLAALLAAATAFAHHLSFALLGFSFAMVLLLEVLVERRPSAAGRAAFFALTLAVATAGLLVLARPSGRFDLAHAFKFEREHITDLFKAWEAMGPVLILGGLAGLLASLVRHKDSSERLLPAWAIALIAFWVAWDMVYRAAVWWIVHGSWTALTPSRGLTDAAVPLSVCAAALLAGLLDLIPRPAWRWAGVAAVAIALSLLGYRAESDRVRDAPSASGAFDDARALCREVQQRTPLDAIVFAPNAGEVGIWLPYLCNRELNYFPDPGYYQSPYREAKMRIQDPREFARYIASQSQRPTFFATRGRADFALLASAGGWNLYRLEP